MMKQSNRISTLFLLLVMMQWLAAAAVTQPQTFVNLSMRVEEAVKQREALTYRVFGTPERLVLALTLSNMTESAFTVTKETLQTTTRITVESDGMVDIPITAEWDAIAGLSNSMRMRTQMDTPVRVEPKTGVDWRVELRRTDGAGFVAGRYRVKLYIPELPAAATADQPAARPRLVPKEVAAFVITGEPTRGAEEIAARAHRGQVALQTGRWTDALTGFDAALSLDPNDLQSLIGAGDALSHLNRHTEAVARFRQAWLLLPKNGEPSTIPRRLALEYLALNNRTEAERALIEGGVSSTRLSSELNRLADELARRAKKP